MSGGKRKITQDDMLHSLTDKLDQIGEAMEAQHDEHKENLELLLTGTRMLTEELHDLKALNLENKTSSAAIATRLAALEGTVTTIATTIADQAVMLNELFQQRLSKSDQKLISGVADTMFVNSKKPSHDDISTTLLRSHPEKFNLTNVAKLNIAVQQTAIKLSTRRSNATQTMKRVVPQILAGALFATFADDEKRKMTKKVANAAFPKRKGRLTASDKEFATQFLEEYTF